jgi:hypothetical protein
MECPQTGEGGWRNQNADGGLERMAPCHGLGNISIIGLWALPLNVAERKSRECAKQSDENTMESTDR